MGTSYSTIINNPVVKESLDNIKNNISVNSVKTCSSTNNNFQSISIKGIKAENCDINIQNIKQSIDTNINSTCVQDTNYKEMIKFSVQQELDKLKKEGNTDLATQIETIITNNVNIDNITKCMSDVYNKQIIDAGNFEISCPKSGILTIDNISQTIASDLVFDCVQMENANIVDQLNNIDVKESNLQISTLTNQEIIGLSVGILLVVLVFILILIGLYMYYLKISKL